MPRRKKKVSRYVLFGCPIDIAKRYDVAGYLGKTADGIGFVDELSDAIVYHDDKKPGHGTPEDWAKLFKTDYGFNVRPVKLIESEQK